MISEMDPWLKTLLLIVAAKIDRDGPIRVTEDRVGRLDPSDILRLKSDVNHRSGTVTISLEEKP